VKELDKKKKNLGKQASSFEQSSASSSTGNPQSTP